MRTNGWQRIVLTVGLAFLLAADGAFGATDIDASTAISLAAKACAASWGAYSRSQGRDWTVDPKKWRARLVGEHWKVWQGDENNPSLSVEVPANGQPLDPETSCKLQFQD